jgi:ferredoxin
MFKQKGLAADHYGTTLIELYLCLQGKNKMMKSLRKHNSTDHIYLNTHLCEACWKCIEVCPGGVIGKVEMLFHRHARIEHAGDCRGCQKCIKACPSQAIIALTIKQQDN